MGVPNIFGNATTTIPLSELDVNFATQITIGNTSVGLGNTVTAFTPNSVAGIVGTVTDDNVNAGGIGEYIEANVASGAPISLTSGVAVNITSIPLTAGDWDVNGTTGVTGGASTTVTVLISGISTTSASLGARGVTSRFDASYGGTTIFTSNDVSLPLGPARFSLSGNATAYLVVDAVFAVSTASAYGEIRARRIR